MAHYDDERLKDLTPQAMQYNEREYRLKCVRNTVKELANMNVDLDYKGKCPFMLSYVASCSSLMLLEKELSK